MLSVNYPEELQFCMVLHYTVDYFKKHLLMHVTDFTTLSCVL